MPRPTKPKAVSGGEALSAQGPISGRNTERGGSAFSTAPRLVWAVSRALDKPGLLTLAPHEGLGCVDKRA